ncbi:hypothetical protein GGX14DRAFT_561060 [Mycena pura]|uniref:Uncharacterized protein n=1 Tax=Mycena pura TaxID=153505 RepID=A0AAD6YIY8_9AGAR|nr:hypothetical protein GGX14DRAFT_561060 [Mycena pura]
MSLTVEPASFSAPEDEQGGTAARRWPCYFPSSYRRPHLSAIAKISMHTALRFQLFSYCLALPLVLVLLLRIYSDEAHRVGPNIPFVRYLSANDDADDYKLDASHNAASWEE